MENTRKKIEHKRQKKKIEEIIYSKQENKQRKKKNERFTLIIRKGIRNRKQRKREGERKKENIKWSMTNFYAY